MGDTEIEPWRRTSELADQNALNIATSSWNAENEQQLLEAMALSGALEFGAVGLCGLHGVHAKITGNAEWRHAHQSATTYYAGSVRALLVAIDRVVAEVYEGGSGITAAATGIALNAQLGGSDLAHWYRLEVLFDALNATGLRAGARSVAWRMLHLERAFSQWSDRPRPWPLLLWLKETSFDETEVQLVRAHIQDLVQVALRQSRREVLTAALFTHHRVLDEPLSITVESEVAAWIDRHLGSGDVVEERLVASGLLEEWCQEAE